MVFHNPWGLLALMSLPAIFALHFFRDRRRVQRIGGLHLWEFARMRLPAGGRFDRLHRSLSLWSQLAAALLLSLLIAGFDIPIESSVRHYTVVLDDSVSMTAGGTAASPEARARAFLDGWMRGRDRFTVIAAGLTPQMVAGPLAGADEARQALDGWHPAATACDLEAAINLAGKFVSADEKILYATDRVDEAEPYAGGVEVAAFGKQQPNSAIVFADRMRLSPERDKVLATVQAFGAGPAEVTATATAPGGELFRQTLKLEPGKPVGLAFETNVLDQQIELRLSEDALAADNVALLDPVPIKPVKVATAGLDPVANYFARAVAAVPYARTVDPGDAPDLLFTAAGAPAGAPWRTVVLPAAATATSATMAQGTTLIVDTRDDLVSGLSLDGVIWPYSAGWRPAGQRRTGASALIGARGEPLFYELATAAPRRAFALNLLWDRTNLFREPAWPVLVQALAEECRQSLPGMTQANFRQGEPVALPLEPDPAGPPTITLWRGGRQTESWDALPPQLSDLAPGSYEVRQGGERVLGRFTVNLLAPDESDLGGAAARRADLGQLTPGEQRRSEASPLVFYAILLAILLLTGMSWVYQDTSR